MGEIKKKTFQNSVLLDQRNRVYIKNRKRQVCLKNNTLISNYFLDLI